MPPRKATASDGPPTKKRKLAAPETPRVVINEGAWVAWPAPKDQVDRARAFIREWTVTEPSILPLTLRSASSKDPIVIVPDKDADGLSSSRVLYETLKLLGVPEAKIAVHLITKGVNLHSDGGRELLREVVTAHAATHSASSARIIVVDQGSRPGPPFVASTPELAIRTLVIDHHLSDAWPDEAEVVTACNAQPICTSSLLSYLVCCPLHPSVEVDLAWFSIIGIFGDLGQQAIDFKRLVADPDGDSAWPDCQELRSLSAACKEYGKKALGEAVSRLNAPRRTPEYDVPKAWEAMRTAKSPIALANDEYLCECRDRVSAENERVGRAPPKFSKDGRVALLRIDSGYQVHPLIATKWLIMCANTGHSPDGRVSFSCRIAASLRKLPQDERPNLQEVLREYGRKANEINPAWFEQVGGDFAAGHREATGGIIAPELFEQFCSAMEIGVKPDTPTKRVKKLESGQQTLGNFFASPSTKIASPSKPASSSRS